MKIKTSIGVARLDLVLVQPSPRMVWVTKPVILRKLPITAVQPTPRQAAWRGVFALSARNWRGAKGTDTLRYDSVSGKHKAGDRVLKVQAVAQEVLKGVYGKVSGVLPPGKRPLTPEERDRKIEETVARLSEKAGVDIMARIAAALR